MKQVQIALLCSLFLLAGCSGKPLSSNGTETAPSATGTTESRTTVASATASTTASAESLKTTVASQTTAVAPQTTTGKPTTTVSATGRTTVAFSTTVSSKTVTSQTTTTVPETTTTASATATARQEVSVTIPEGYTFMQIATLLEQNGVCTAAEFYNTCQTYTPQSFTIPTGTDRCFRMEGYLFPDTYRFYVNDNPQTVLIRMLNNYRSKVGNLSDDTLILASIIEREARSDKHMKLVSSVYHNRLSHSSEFPYLNADPTRDYVNQYITGNPLVSNPSQYAPLYNTCGKRKGLPAGPICNPGLRAIRAAQSPTESPYYYFFYGKDNDNHYSETLEEHNRQIAEIGVG